MTPTEIENDARERYNAINDTFYSQGMLLNLMYDACMEFAKVTKCIRNIYTTDSVAGQDEYAKPTRAIGIVKVFYDGRILEPMTIRERDQYLIGGSPANTTGVPRYYTIWGDAVFLTPTPDTAVTEALKIWSYDEPYTITVNTNIPIPSRYHKDVIYHVLEGMALKDDNFNRANAYAAKFIEGLKNAKAYEKKLIALDRMPHVHDIDSDPYSYSGRF